MFWIRREISEAASRIPMEIDSPFVLVWSMTSGGSFHHCARGDLGKRLNEGPLLPLETVY